MIRALAPLLAMRSGKGSEEAPGNIGARAAATAAISAPSPPTRVTFNALEGIVSSGGDWSGLGLRPGIFVGIRHLLSGGFAGSSTREH
jgi:hypothetical protein